jgi:hypothetical protein
MLFHGTGCYRAPPEVDSDEMSECGFNIITYRTEKNTRHRHAFKEGNTITLLAMESCAFRSLYMRYRTDPKVYDLFAGTTSARSKSEMSARGTSNLFADVAPSELLRRAKDIVLPEFTGPFPLARLNCFAVSKFAFEILMEIVTRVGALGYKALPLYMRDVACMHYPDLIEGLKEVNIFTAKFYMKLMMSQIDFGQHSGRMRRTEMRTFDPVVLLRDAVVKVCEGKEVEYFLWKEV